MNHSTKEFGKLSLPQLQELAKLLPEMLGQLIELPEILAQKSDKVAEIMGSRYAWASIYEEPFLKQLYILFYLLGIHGKLDEAATSTDPQEHVSKLFSDGGELDEWYGENEEAIDKRLLVTLVTVLIRNAHSMMLNQCSLDVLVARARQGDDRAFFDAVRVDRSILACPTFADRLARAELEDDAAFFHDLALALKGPRERPANDKIINYLMMALHEAGVTSLTDDRWKSLFEDDLGLVETGPDSDSVEALKQRFYRVGKKSKT